MIDQLISILEEIIITSYEERSLLIKKFQNLVWNDESIKNEKLNNLISELAYDLDFYEPNKEWRKDNSSYYGDEKLEDIVKKGLEELSVYK